MKAIMIFGFVCLGLYIGLSPEMSSAIGIDIPLLPWRWLLMVGYMTSMCGVLVIIYVRKIKTNLITTVGNGDADEHKGKKEI